MSARLVKHFDDAAGATELTAWSTGRENMRASTGGFVTTLRPVLLGVLLATAVRAEVTEPVPLPLTLLDLPEAVVTPQHAPTWRQSLELQGGVTRAVHLGLHTAFSSLSTAWWSVLLETASAALFDLLSFTLPLPLTQGWAHEEGHRAAMGVVGIPSLQAFDNVFLSTAERCDENSVCGMTDQQIAAVHDRRAADWVRVQEAGMETELELGRSLLRDAFFFEQPRALNVPAAWLAYASVEIYRHACAEPGLFDETMVTSESANPLQRDFTGPDCTGWVTDLHRPTAPYLAREPHPNGGGVRRVRLAGDLTLAERKHLIHARNLGLLNFVDPALFAFPRFTFTLGSGARVDVTASLQHDLTAFGDAFGLQAMLRAGQLNLVGVLRAYRNEQLTLPGLSVGVRRFAFRVGDVVAHTNVGVDLWVQPTDFSFQTRSVQPGAALEADVAVPLAGPLEAFLAVRAKTAGWRPVDPFLDPSVGVRVGVNVLFPR